MPRHRLKEIIVIVLVGIALCCSLLLGMERKTPAHGVDLAPVPARIGTWRMVGEHNGMTAQEKGFLNNVLFRVYERGDGKEVVLAIAYGADQRQNFRIHAPEGCYRAAGYDITTLGLCRLGRPAIPMKQIFADKGKSGEAIQYWIVMNGEVVTNHYERKIRQLWYSLMGTRAGGVLVRISSPSTGKDLPALFAMQQEFITALYGAVDGEQRKMLFGNENI